MEKITGQTRRGWKLAGVYFAYDGSIHADWILHYAARLAANHLEKRLHLVHICESATDGVLPEKIDRIRAECRRIDVELEPHNLRPAGTLHETICSAVPEGPTNYLVCGTRAGERKQGILRGTVSERLLRSGHCHVLAVRVVQPGLLGLPRQLLLPVSGHPRGFRSGLPFLRLFANDVAHLHVLYVELVSHWRFRLLPHEAIDRLRRPGQAYCEQTAREIRDHLELGARKVDTQVLVSDDVPKEIVITANKTHSRLIYLGASERNLTKRIFFGNPIEQVLRDATCDVAIYRGLE